MGGGMGGAGGNNPFEMGKAKAKLEMEPNTGVKFVDVAGCDGSKLELTEVGMRTKMCKDVHMFTCRQFNIPAKHVGLKVEGVIVLFVAACAQFLLQSLLELSKHTHSQHFSTTPFLLLSLFHSRWWSSS